MDQQFVPSLSKSYREKPFTFSRVRTSTKIMNIEMVDFLYPLVQERRCSATAEDARFSNEPSIIKKATKKLRHRKRE